MHVTLFTDEAGGITPGTSIVYKGLDAGKIETRVFHPENGKIEFGAFISRGYAPLVRQNTKFWNVSGIDVQLGANGLHLHAGTLESLLLGGITFGQPDGVVSSAPPVNDGAIFVLYDSVDDTKKFTMKNSLPYLLLFSGSVRGLSEDAPVEFRGVRVGTVRGVSFRYLPNDPERRVPVLVQIDPGIVTNLPSDNTGPAEEFVSRSVQAGLRASLKTGSFLTGQLYVDLDFQKDAPPASVVDLEGYHVIPTSAGGLAELQDKAMAVMDKIKSLPLEDAVKNASEALAAVKVTAESAGKTLNGFNEDSPVYKQLSTTLRELDETLRSVRAFADTLEEKPNALIFGKGKKSTPPPERARRR